MKLIKIILLTIMLCSCSVKEQEDTFFAMNTVMTVKTYGTKNIMSDINNLITEYDHMFDRKNESSDIYKINNHIKADLNYKTISLINSAVDIAKNTDGCFDITIAPIMDLWGFYNQNFHVPTEYDIKKALESVDFNNITINNSNVILNKGSIDLGGIAKGFLSDDIANMIRESGINSAIMSLGGNIYCVGSRPNGDMWNVGIKDPKNSSESICSVKVSDTAIVTSGIYERDFEANGTYYHHIIDPSTGFPVNNGLSSVTVICKSGTKADALSTALFVMGIDRAMSIKTDDFELIFITTNNDIFITPGIMDCFTTEHQYTVLK